MTELVGKSLQNGKYILDRELGQGGFGVTYKATDKSSDREVVIKTINSHLQHKSDRTRLNFEFGNEARRLSQCSHPNIVEYRDFFVENGFPFIVMEYIPGVSLDRLIQRNKPLPEAIAVNYIKQVGQALTVIHHNGLLHRDLKPENMILREGTQQVMLIDFGIAREFSQGVTKTHTNLITNGYAPIEQYFPKAKRTAATDVYALAATLYTLLTGEIPLAASLRDRLPFASPKDLVPQLSDKISDAVMCGMALEPEDRPSSISEWLTLLRGTQSQLISYNRSTRASLANRTTKNYRSLPKLTPILAGAIGLLGFVLGIASSRSPIPTTQNQIKENDPASTLEIKSSEQLNSETIQPFTEILTLPPQNVSETTPTQSPTISPELDNQQAEKQKQQAAAAEKQRQQAAAAEKQRQQAAAAEKQRQQAAAAEKQR
nr:serine/threonine-protein kinase [Prochloraceae cyanobacterium]